MILPILFVTAAAAAEPKVDFDQGKTGVTEIVAAARAGAKAAAIHEAAQPKAKAVARIEGRSGHAAKGIGPLRWDRDCVEFIFEPKDKESEAVYLRSQEWENECHPGPRGEMNCWERPGMVTNAKVQIRIPERKQPLPWELEHFYMCLEGNWITYDEGATAFTYDSKFLDNSGILIDTPKDKIPMSPDKNGINAASFAQTGDNFTAAFADKWASYYKGETTVLKVALRRKGFLGSSKIFETELKLPAADTYTVRFADYADKFEDKLEDGQKYFVAWSFQRLGKISTDKKIGKDDTSSLEFHKASAAGAR